MGEMLNLQFRGIPDYVFIVSFFILSIMIVGVFFLRKDLTATRRMIFGMLLMEYVFLMLCSTVICRVSKPDIIRLELMPFWNYGEIMTMKDPNDQWEVVLNVILYAPIGFLLASIGRFKWHHVVAICGVLSIVTESLQFFLHRGLCETDDVIHNTLGCLVGMGVYALVRNCFRRIKN